MTLQRKPEETFYNFANFKWAVDSKTVINQNGVQIIKNLSRIWVYTNHLFLISQNKSIWGFVHQISKKKKKKKNTISHCNKSNHFSSICFAILSKLITFWPVLIEFAWLFYAFIRKWSFISILRTQSGNNHYDGRSSSFWVFSMLSAWVLGVIMRRPS